MADIEEGFSLYDYVRIEQPDGNVWIGQIVQPNQNISTVGDRLDPTILHGLRLMQTRSNIQSVESVQIFDILILGEYDGRQMLTPRVRPLPGAIINRLSAEDTCRVIEIPRIRDHKDGTPNVIGELLNADNVPLCIDEAKFNYHIMIAGGTGSGKSNVAANLVDQASKYRKCVLIHDAKPDYTLISSPNSDSNVTTVWKRFEKYSLAPHETANVTRIGFYGKCDQSGVQIVVGLRASDFNPEMLAGFFFSGPAEQLQFEEFASATGAFEERRRNKEIQTYSLDDILNIVQRRMDPTFGDPRLQINEAVGKAILRKARARRQGMPWLDAVGQPAGRQSLNRLRASRLDSDQMQNVAAFNLEEYIQKGQLLVIDYSQMDEQSYALILSYFLRICHQYRQRRNPVGIVQLVDEAHRIFDNESRHSATLARTFERVMREGRSADHSIILSLQNASQIPPRVMNNLNTKIVMRQNSKFEADAATQTMGKDFSLQAMRLGTGHALVSMHESRATVLAQMAPSPFELMRTDNAGHIAREPVAAEEDNDDVPF
jgi:DNA helicase HerA-like ATPase